MTDVIHSFMDSLEWSERQAGDPVWEQCYRKAFTGFDRMEYVKYNKEFQLAGIDRFVYVCNAGVERNIAIDEKIRQEDWDDILLERWSVWREGRPETNQPGWTVKPLACDYIAYAFKPSKRCYLLPAPALQAAYRKNGESWERQYRFKDARNPGYITRNVPVPIPVLMKAVSDSFLVRWD